MLGGLILFEEVIFLWFLWSRGLPYSHGFIWSLTEIIILRKEVRKQTRIWKVMCLDDVGEVGEGYGGN